MNEHCGSTEYSCMIFVNGGCACPCRSCESDHRPSDIELASQQAAELSALRARVAELESERLRALKIADALTLDTQSLPEAVDALVEMVRSARRERDEYRKTAHEQNVALSRISGTLCDASDVVVDPLPEGVAELLRQRDEALEECGALLARVDELQGSVELAALRTIQSDIALLTSERDAARRDLEAALVFQPSDHVLVERDDDEGVERWRVHHSHRFVCHRDTRDAALAEARRLAGIT